VHGPSSAGSTPQPEFVGDLPTHKRLPPSTEEAFGQGSSLYRSAEEGKKKRRKP